MHRIWPPQHHGPVEHADLERLYDYPATNSAWLAVNFVASADGAMNIAGRSAGLTNSVDRQVYPLGADLADVILVGASTAIIEQFGRIEPSEETLQLRKRHGLVPVPPIAVVTTGASLPAAPPVLTDVGTPTIVLTCAAAPVERQQAWQAAGAQVLVAGDDTVDLAGAVQALAERGLRRIHCDGGPRLFAALVAAGVVDELRLTLSPQLVAGTSGRITSDTDIDPTALTLDSVLAEGDTLLLRYLLHQ